jgi:hypothetical protein
MVVIKNGSGLCNSGHPKCLVYYRIKSYPRTHERRRVCSVVYLRHVYENVEN